MKRSKISLGIVLLAMGLLAGCGAAKQKPAVPAEAPQAPTQEQVEQKAEEKQVEQKAEAAEEKVMELLREADTDPAYEQKEEEQAAVPPPRAIEQAEPPAMAQEAPPVEEYVAVVEAPPQPASAAPDFGTVFFDFDKHNIKPEFEQTIRENARKLMADGSLSAIVEGHCDERGTTEYNLALGERRARAVRDALLSAGVKANQLDTVSYGEERPVAFGSDEAAWGQNRRAAMTIR